MPHQTRAIVLGRFRLRECRAAQRIDGARGLRREKERLAAVQLRLEDVVALRQLAAPRPLRLRPRCEALLRLVEGFFVRGREERREAAVLRQREDAPFGEKCERVVQRPQLPVRSQPAVMEAPGAKLS
jgi:hypothetical protein